MHRPGEHAEFVRRARAALLPFLLFRGARFFSLWDLMARVRSRPFVGHTAGEAICEGLDLIVMVGASKRRHGPASPNSFGAFYNESPCDRELEVGEFRVRVTFENPRFRDDTGSPESQQ